MVLATFQQLVENVWICAYNLMTWACIVLDVCRTY